VRSDFRLVVDLDNTTNNGYGEYYNSGSVLSPETIKAL
jgi:hypothetical protein